MALVLASCTAATPTTSSASATPPAPAALSAPEWRPGDRWVYDWTSGDRSGTKTIEMREAKTVNGVPYYIVRLDDVDHYYTTALHWAAAIRESRVEARMVPPQPWFTWPLTPAKRWEHRGTFQDRNGTSRFADRFTVAGIETVDVPAGRFQAMKVTRQSDGRDSDDYWYAADARWYVRWVGRRGDVTFEERLKEYRPVPR